MLASTRPKLNLRYVHRASVATGASASRNAGVAATVCPLIAFLDDDDLWESTHLTLLRAALIREEADLAVAWMSAIEPDGLVRDHYAIRRGLLSTEVRAQNPGITGSNFLVRRNAFVAIGGFDEMLPVSNDKDYFIRVIDAGQRYAVSPKRTAYHRRHNAGQLTSWDGRRAAATKMLIDKHRETLSRADMRYMNAKLHSMARRETRGLRRLWHTVNVLARTPARELWLRALGRGRET